MLSGPNQIQWFIPNMYSIELMEQEEILILKQLVEVSFQPWMQLMIIEKTSKRHLGIMIEQLANIELQDLYLQLQAPANQ